MPENDLKRRTKDFAVRILKLVDDLPDARASRTIASQLARTGTSVAVNYRAGFRAKATADVAAKIRMAEEDADETAFWLELLSDAGLMSATQTAALLKEAGELTAIMIVYRRTVLERAQQPPTAARKPAPKPA